LDQDQVVRILQFQLRCDTNQRIILSQAHIDAFEFGERMLLNFILRRGLVFLNWHFYILSIIGGGSAVTAYAATRDQ
jgi:hypothetical protein